MNSNLSTSKILELLQRLKAALEDFANRSGKLDGDMRLRIARERQLRDRAVQAVSASEEMAGMVVGLGDGRVAWLDDQGRLLWEQDIGRVVTWLAVADLDHDGHDDVIARSGDNVYRLQAGDGTINWRTDTQAERIIGVALDHGVLVGTDRRVYRLDATGTGQADFATAVTAGVGSGASALSIGASWTQSQTETSNPAYTVLVDATAIVQHYVASDALLLFASAVGDIGVQVFGANQWGGGADIRVKFTPEPVSLALLAMGGLVALRRRR